MQHYLAPYLTHLKWIAVFAMVVDHSGIFLFNNEDILRTIGRVAFPMFGLIVAYNFLYNSRNKNKFIQRMIVFAMISQIPYGMYWDNLNILFLYAFAMIGFLACEKIKSRVNLFLALLPLLILSKYADYGIFGFLFMMTVYFALKNNNMWLFVLSIFLLARVNLVFGADIAIMGAIEYLAIVSYILLSSKTTKAQRAHRHHKRYKYAMYWFYPIHLLIIFLLLW